MNMKKNEKHLEISSFYTCIPKILIIWCTVPEICCMRDRQMVRETEKVTYRGEWPHLKKLYDPFLEMGFNFLNATKSLRGGSLLFTIHFLGILSWLTSEGRKVGLTLDPPCGIEPGTPEYFLNKRQIWKMRVFWYELTEKNIFFYFQKSVFLIFVKIWTPIFPFYFCLINLWCK